MKALKELHSVSEYEPSRGDLLSLFTMAIKLPDFDRKKAKAAFLEQNKTKGQFRMTYKTLKDKLLNGIFSNSFTNYDTVQRAHFHIWKCYAGSKTLIGLDKKIAGISLAQETFRAAQKYGLIDIALSLSRELEMHFATVEPDKKKTRDFRRIKEELLERLVDEVKAEGILLDLINRINLGDDTKGFTTRIEAIENNRNLDYRYNFYVFTCKTLLCNIRGYGNELLETCQKAITFFESIKSPLPYFVRWNFLFQATPILIGKQDYAIAENYAKYCVKITKLGGYNWHLSLLHLALVGFHSGKPAIALEAWKTSKRHMAKFESVMVEERWKIIEAHLHIYAKLGVIAMPTKFRLGKFLNEMIESEKRKAGQNVSILIVQLLHLLLDDKKEQFMSKSERIDKYIHVHLSSEKHTRSRNFLKMLKQVEHGDYQQKGVEQLADKYLVQLRVAEMSINVDLLENEVVRYERLWELIIGFLR
ncbi:MAG: hypothetical protein ACPG44_09185 [Polaribacter sp.]